MATTAITVGPVAVNHLLVDQAADTGPTALVAAVTNKRICVPAIHLVMDVAGTWVLLSGETALTPAMPTAATGGFTDAAILMFGLPVPIFWTEKSEALNLTTVGGAVQGYLKYFTWGD